jgi:hypothetical protein
VIAAGGRVLHSDMAFEVLQSCMLKPVSNILAYLTVATIFKMNVRQEKETAEVALRVGREVCVI